MSTDIHRQLPRDLLVAARESEAMARQRLDEACQRAIDVAGGKNWLAGRPDFQQKQNDFQKAERRWDLYQQALARLTLTWIDGRLRSLSPKRLGHHRTGNEVEKAYCDLRRAVRDPQLRLDRLSIISTILGLDRDLDAAGKLLLSDILQADSDLGDLQQSRELEAEVKQFFHDSKGSFIRDETREAEAAHEASVKKVSDARSEVVAQFLHRLEQKPTDVCISDFAPEGDHTLRQELEGFKASYERRLREVENRLKERLWWENVDSWPIDAILDRLDRVPAQRTIAVLRRLLTMSATDPRIHDSSVQRFFGKKHHCLLGSTDIVRPLLVAHLAGLIAEGRVGAARAILDGMPKVAGSPLEGVIAYLRFIAAEPPSLAGTTYFRDLSPEDFFLGACYYGNGVASVLLDSQAQWDYHSLLAARDAGNDDNRNRAVKNYKVSGLQPRIAELAFKEIYERLYGATAARRLQDLNFERVKSLPQPWLRASPPDLPAADWKAPDGNEYDVKCNLFFRSKAPRIGLRGFLIRKLKRDPARAFPGIVFTNTTDDSCDWVHVGDYRPSPADDIKNDRVLPFYFRLPDSERVGLPNVSQDDFDRGIQILRDHRLRIGWIFAAGQKRALAQIRGGQTSLLYRWAFRCLNSVAGSHLERALWRGLTEMTIEACGQNRFDIVQHFLREAAQLISDGMLPVRLPKIGGEALLNLWISEVLRPITENWAKIDLPACKRCRSKDSTTALRLTTMTSEGTIRGEMTCKHCDQAREFTVFTHCYSCPRYPLVIGLNQTCAECTGLICECGCCMNRTCTERRRRRAAWTHQ